VRARTRARVSRAAPLRRDRLRFPGDVGQAGCGLGQQLRARGRAPGRTRPAQCGASEAECDTMRDLLHHLQCRLVRGGYRTWGAAASALICIAGACKAACTAGCVVGGGRGQRGRRVVESSRSTRRFSPLVCITGRLPRSMLAPQRGRRPALRASRRRPHSQPPPHPPRPDSSAAGAGSWHWSRLSLTWRRGQRRTR
jgi:hypothetical protein